MSRPHASESAPAPRPIAETALLWSMRTWVVGRQQAEQDIDRVFAHLGAPEAAAYLYGFMWTLEHGACRSLAICRPCQPEVSADEQALLDALALTQEGQGFERLLLLRALLRPKATAPAGQSAAGLVRALNKVGLFLEPCFPPVRRHAFPPTTERTNAPETRRR